MRFLAPMRRPVGAIVLLCLLVSGCASLGPQRGAPAAIPADAAPTAGRLYHQNIDLSGRLALRYEQKGAPQALDGKFTWAQQGDTTQITLLTPFGQTLATIEVGPTTSTLTQAGQAPRSAASVDSLVADTLGWPLPLAGLHDWLQGFGTDMKGGRFTATASAAGDAEYVHSAEGWLLHYPTWETNTGTEARPRRIDLQRQTTQAGNVTLRIVLDQWQPR